MPALRRLAAGIDRANSLLGRAAGWLLAAMAAVLFVVIVLGSMFRVGYVWMQELVIYLHGIIFMSAAAYTLLHNGHVRIDVVYGHLSRRGRATVDLLGSLLLLLPTCGAILYFSLGYVLDSWRVWEGSPEAGGIPATFLLKTFILVFVVTFALQGLSLLAKSVDALRGADAGEDGPADAGPRPEP